MPATEADNSQAPFCGLEITIESLHKQSCCVDAFDQSDT
jgi:hypothetical protein